MWRTLAQLQSDWNRYAKADPLWAIRTDLAMKNRQWEPHAFFEAGQREIEDLMRYADSLGVELGRRHALDFGCGVGRLTRALADHFDQVCGVDISSAMLELAREYNAQIPNCVFVQNTEPSFREFPVGNFDLIYSNLTLQHMPPRYMKRYLRGLVRRLRPGGLLIFQLPDQSQMGLVDRVRSFLYKEIYRRHVLCAEPSMDMYGLRKRRVVAFIERSGCRVLDVTPNCAAGPEWTSYRYAAVREDAPPLEKLQGRKSRTHI
jgi:SAM-dependent methyltransferase